MASFSTSRITGTNAPTRRSAILSQRRDDLGGTVSERTLKLDRRRRALGVRHVISSLACIRYCNQFSEAGDIPQKRHRALRASLPDKTCVNNVVAVAHRPIFRDLAHEHATTLNTI